MKCLILASILFTHTVHAQEKPLLYSKVLVLDSVSKNDIYDRALLWCSKSFKDSKSAINVKDKESGIIAGKAFFLSGYKMPRKKDSVLSVTFSNYYFDLLIEIKDGKARFSLSNIMLKEMDQEFLVNENSKPPFKVWLQPDSRTQLEWDISKKYFIASMEVLSGLLYSDLVKKPDNW